MLRSLTPDVDTTLIDLSILYKLGKLGSGGMSVLNDALNAMLSQPMCAGHAPILSFVISAMFLFHLVSRRDEVRGNEEFFGDALRHHAYACGNLYYDLEAILFHVAWLV
jgi:hypothetical protein